MKYIIANWKMKMTIEEVQSWTESWNILDYKNESITPIISPSHVHLYLMEKINNVETAAQDVSTQTKGSHTGEVGVFQIKEYANYSIVGHSERLEDREIVLKKAKNCMEKGIIPIICFRNPTLALDYYLEGALLAWEDPENIATEGVYKPKDPADIKKQMEYIKELLPNDTHVLYGGSVNRNNVTNLRDTGLIDGLLIGTASLDPKHFFDICLGFQD